MRNGVFPTARQRVFNRQFRSPAGGRVCLLFALLVSVLVMSSAGVTWSQDQPQPTPQPPGVGPSDPERQFDVQAQELEARRTELVRSLQRTEMQLQQLVFEQDQQRRALQKELSDLQERLRDVESQLADLPRQRLRAKYLAALQALEQARGKRRQAEEQADAARLAEQDAALAVERLRQLLGQMPPLPPGPAGPGQPGRAVGGAGETPGHAQIRRENPAPQWESLRDEIHRAGEQINAVTARMDTTRETLSREISAVRAEVQQMGQTLGRIEQERLEAQGNLRAGVVELRGHLEQVQQLCQARRTLDIALMQPHISTVGSAAYR